MTAMIVPKSERIVLHDVSWNFYERVLREVADRHIFVTYDNGSLEMMSPSWRHETFGRRMARLIQVVTEELDMPMTSGGSTTFRRRDLRKGLEPDECFYLNNAHAVVGKDK